MRITADQNLSNRNLALVDAINAERDARIAAGFAFMGKVIQARPFDIENIIGASTGALGAMATGGVLPGNYRWHGGAEDFVWITDDNTGLTLDAHGMWALGQAALAHRASHIFAARNLKNMDPIPHDFTDDGYWP